MSFKCKIGIHSWDSCKCTKCNKTRNQQHDFSQDCEQCSQCGYIIKNQHNWNYCKCTKCNKTRNQQHDFSKDCEQCSHCGNIFKNQHNWNYCKCSTCGKIIEDPDDWTIVCGDCTKCNDSFIKAYESFKNQSLETAANELLNIIIKNEYISQLKSATAIGLANIATNKVNRKIKYCEQFHFSWEGCSDHNTPYYEAQAELKETKKRATELYDLALRLEPNNQQILSLMQQLEKV